MNKELITARMPVCGISARVTVLYEDGHPAEIYIEPEHMISQVGRILIGKVESVAAGLNAAFVRTGAEQRVYMPLDNMRGEIRAGTELPVQIIQEAHKTKLPKVSAEWEIAGDYMVLSSVIRKPSYSRKLSSEQKTILKHICSGWDTSDCGILFRTRAAYAEEDELLKEFQALQKTVSQIRLKAASRPCYTVLYEAPDIRHRLISRCRPGELQRFLTDDASLVPALGDVCAGIGCEVQLYDDPQLALYRLRSLSGLLDRLTSSVVHLRSGASLIIEQTEAFAVIDVNTARFTGKKDHRETVRQINAEAAAEAARQIRLRQLSGTILIDFINGSELQEEELGRILTRAFMQDPVSTRVIDFTRLHICEITRRKIHRPLQEQILSLKSSDKRS